MSESPGHPFVHPTRPSIVPLIAPGELARALAAGESLVLLDVRPDSERSVVHLPNDRHIPVSDLPRRRTELAAYSRVVAYDQFGADARRAIGFLRANGFSNAEALEGGIDEYARTVDPTIARYDPSVRDHGFLWRSFPRAESGCLAYLVGEPGSGTAALIDPGAEPAPYLAALRESGLTLSAIVETHTHADHRAGHAALHEKTGAPIFLSHRSPASYPHQNLAHGDSVSLGESAIVAWETPGHTRDHLTLLLPGKAFTGDTLLLGSCGRADLGDGSPELLWESLQEKLLRLPDETEVMPAHFGPRHALPDRPSSTIGFERATNEALRQPDHAAFIQYMTEGWPPKPASFDRIVSENLTS